MNEVMIFNNPEFGQVRTVTVDGEPWFVGKDVAEALGYSNTRDAIAKHVVTEDRTDVAIHDGSQNRTMTIINESGLYTLIFGSKLASAVRFKRWVTSEVLPSIRKNGGYIANQENLTPEQIVANALVVAQNIINQKDKQIQEMKPKALFADAVASSSTSILIGDLAKLLKQNGVETGQKRLFEQLRNEGYLIKNGISKNMPTQKSMELGLFDIKETIITNPDGSIRTTRTTKVTGKGQQYFINKYLQEGGEEGGKRNVSMGKSHQT